MKCGESIENIDGTTTHKEYVWGRSVTTTYNSKGQLVWSEDSYGNYILPDYDSNGSIDYLYDTQMGRRMR